MPLAGQSAYNERRIEHASILFQQLRFHGVEMGIRFTCPSGHKLHVKTFLAGKRGVCPQCGAIFVIPSEPESSPAAGSAAGLRPPGANDTSARLAESPDPASVSILIDLADERAVSAPPDDGSEIRLAEDRPLPPKPSQPGHAPQPDLVAPCLTAESPAVRHISRRERRRRDQFNTAILLLAAVIVLALVLVWILRRGTAPTSAGSGSSSSIVAAQLAPCGAFDFHPTILSRGRLL